MSTYSSELTCGLSTNRFRIKVDEDRSTNGKSKITVTFQYRRTNSYTSYSTSVGNACTIGDKDARTVSVSSTSWKSFGTVTKTYSHTAAKTITIKYKSTDSQGYFNTSQGSLSFTMAAFVTAIDVSVASSTSNSSNVSAKLKWTDQDGANVNIRCEEIDDSGNYKQCLKEWTSQKGKSGTTYTADAADRTTLDSNKRNKVRWTLKTIVDSSVFATKYKDLTYDRKSVPTLSASSVTVGNNETIYFNRQKSGLTHTVSVKVTGSTTSWSKTLVTKSTGTSYTWSTSGDASSIYATNITGNSATAVFTLTTYNSSGTSIGTNTVSATLNFNTTTLAPTFSNFTWRDSNDDIVALTGSDAVLVQNKSTLEVTIPSENKMIANYSATAKSYTATIGSTSASGNYSDTDDVVITVGKPTASGSQNIYVKAFDSRSNSKQVSKTTSVIAYSNPTLSATAKRENGFEAQTTLSISGTYATVTVDDEEKNYITAVQYRNKQSSTTDYGDWTDCDFTCSGGKLTVTDTVLNCDNEYGWDFQIQATDLFGATTTVSVSISRGIPIFYIHKDGLVGVNKIPENAALDISGDMYMSGQVTSSSNIPTAAIVDKAVTTAKLADSSITSAKIADSAVTSGKVASSALNWSHLANWSFRRASSYNTSGFAYADMAAIGFAWGEISITPSAANDPTSKTLIFPITFSSPPVVVCTVNQGDTTAEARVTVTSVGTGSVKIWLVRTNTTATNIFWLAVGSVT